MPPNSLYGLIGLPDRQQQLHVPLEGVSSAVSVRGFVSHIITTLRYRHNGPQPVQAVFRWPVDESSALYHIQAKLNDRVIVGSCLEKKKAEEVYQKAIKAGQTAVLVREESQTADVMSLTLGNLPPEVLVEVTLSLVMEMKVGGDGGVQFRLPTVLNPRYCPADNPGQDYIDTSDDHWRPLVVASKPYTMEVTASITGAHKIARVVSHSDSIEVELEDDRLQAKISNRAGAEKGSKSDHDWSFVVYYDNPYIPQVLVETGLTTASGIMRDQVMMINMFPELPDTSYSHRNEVIFVVDRSGSMSGSNIQSAKAVLLLFLKSLPLGCLFNVVSFGSTNTQLFPGGSQEYTERNLAAACELHGSMEADMGGTEILQPLESIYSRPVNPGYSRQVLLLTDGQVFNVDQVCSLVSRYAGSTRVFAVGIGEGASTALVRGLARAGGGRAEMVAQRDRIVSKVMGLVASMLQSSVRNVKVSWELESPTRLSLVPPTPPVIFAGQHMTAYARMPATAVLKSVSISGDVEGVEWTARVTQEQIKTVHDAALSFHRLAARAKIRDLQTDDTDEARSEVVELSVNTGVLSRFTAMVAVDQDGKSLPLVQSQPDTRQQKSMYGDNLRRGLPLGGSRKNYRSRSPQNLMRFYSQSSSNAVGVHCVGGGATEINFLSDSVDFAQNLPSPPPPPCLHLHDSVDFAQNLPPPPPPPCFGMVSCDRSQEIETTAKESSAPSKDEAFMNLVTSQKFDGTWEIKEVAKALGFTLEEDLKDPKIKGFATALALAVLSRLFNGRSVEWRLLASKATAALERLCSGEDKDKSVAAATEAASVFLAAVEQKQPQCAIFAEH